MDDALYQEERLSKILDQIKKHGRVSVQQICHRFNVSRDTARRDIVRLEELGVIVRTRGGAILPTITKEIHGYWERLNLASTVKNAIARQGANLINDRDRIILDASTTVLYLSDWIRAVEITVVTNGIDVTAALAGKSTVTTHLLGGRLHKEHRFLYGAATIAQLMDYQADKLFISSRGITVDGLSTADEEEGYLLRQMIRQADQVIVLADHSKFGKRHFYNVCAFDSIDIIITDLPPLPDIDPILVNSGVKVILTTDEN